MDTAPDPLAAAVLDLHKPPSASAARPVLLALARHVVTAAGAALAARGWIDADTATTVAAPLAQELAGAILVAGASGGAALRAIVSHNRWADAWRVLRGKAAPITKEKSA